jgi:hypothetical protein
MFILIADSQAAIIGLVQRAWRQATYKFCVGLTLGAMIGAIFF